MSRRRRQRSGRRKKRTEKKEVISRLDLILIAARAKVGTYPGQNRSRKFTDKKKQADKRACRGGKKDG